jgi:Domain of Unknown Function (DUF748)
MRLPVRARWVWLIGIAAGLVAVTWLATQTFEEPARRYMEREINRRLTGYTVTIRALHIHPWNVSLELLDSVISQDANPSPPVARIRSLTAKVDWRALLHRKVVADMTFDRPEVYANLKNLRAESADNVSLKNRGWREALEAVALDLKINRVEVRNGDLTYVDAGPFKPLRVSRLDASAENIRNIRSREREYPSEVHVEGVVFDAGTLWLDGHADFLAEPQVAIRAALRLDQVELDYFKPITNRRNLSVSRGTLSLSGNVEYAPKIARLVLDRVLIEGVQAEYVHTSRTAEAEKARAQQAINAAKQVANKPSTELRIDRLTITKSNLGFVNRVATFEYRLVLADTDLTIQNLSNQRLDGTAVVRLRGRLMGTGETEATMMLQPRRGSADIDLTVRVESADMTRMRGLVRSYGGFDLAAGEFSMYSELRVRNGTITGYVKPLFRNLKVGTPEGEQRESKGFGRRLYETAVAVAAKILKNHSRDEVATVVTISGRVDRPEVSTWEIAGHLLQNAFIKAILPGFDPKRAPKLEAAPGNGR